MKVKYVVNGVSCLYFKIILLKLLILALKKPR